MNRILRRPMFRMGGTPNEGIMTGLKEPKRIGYQPGGPVSPTAFGGALSGLSQTPSLPTSTPSSSFFQPMNYGTAARGIFGAGKKLLGGIASAGRFGLGALANPAALMAAGSVSGPAIIATLNEPKTLEELQYMKEMNETGIMDETASEEDIMEYEKERARLREEGTPIGTGDTSLFSSSKKIEKVIKEKEKKDPPPPPTKINGNKGSKFDRKADLKTIYEDLLPMVKDSLGSDPDEKNRQLYTQLAQFGANLLGQPGGSLTAAIGKAASEPISNVGKILRRESDIDRESRALALKAAIDRSAPGEIGKLIQDLKAADFSDDQIMKYLTDSRSGSATRANIAFQEVQALKEDLTNDFNINKNADTAARTMYDSIALGINQTEYSELPKNKDERVDGKYYVSPNGEVGRYNKEKGTLINPGEPGFLPTKKS